MRILIQWDRDKSDSNIQKHGVAFDEAATVFDDTYLLKLKDHKHSFVEDRFIILGQSSMRRVLFVVYTTRGSSYEKEVEYYRIISARIANKDERRFYHSKS